MHEVEAKILEIDVAALMTKLDELGAKKITEDRLLVNWFRPKNTGEGETPWYLRVRTYVALGKHEVTWKGTSTILGVSRQHKEINFTVDNPEEISELFKELNLECYAHQEKDRKSWKYKNWRFDLDQYPDMPAYVEIEGQNEDHIQEALKILNLTKNKTSAEGERVLIQETYGLNWYNMKFNP